MITKSKFKIGDLVSFYDQIDKPRLGLIIDYRWSTVEEGDKLYTVLANGQNIIRHINYIRKIS